MLYQDIARELIEHGANIHDLDFDKQSALDYTINIKQFELKQVLLGKTTDNYSLIRKDIQSAFYLAHLCKKQDNIEQALKYFELRARNSEGYFFDYHQSNYLRELGMHREAIEIIIRLLSIYPYRTNSMFHTENSLAVLKQYQDAYNMMVDASKIQPQNPLFTNKIEVFSHLI